MSDSDDALMRRYRAAASEEPGAALDAAIVGAARDAVRAKPFARRWTVPVYIAATLVLAFGVTLHFERERPDLGADALRSPGESARAPASSPSPAAPAPAQPRVDEPAASSQPAATESQPVVTESKPAASATRPVTRAKVRSAVPSESPARAQPEASAANDNMQAAPTASANMQAAPSAKVAPVFVPTPQPAAAPPPAIAASPPPAIAASPPPATALRSAAPARAFTEERQLDVAREKRSAAASGALQKDAVESDPLRELERIATLRAEGRDEDADRALEAFRKAHPDYRIEPPMWDRVRKR